MIRPIICTVMLFILAGTLSAEVELPDHNDPDYVFVEDFEDGKGAASKLPVFEIAKKHGIREGAGYKSKFGYSNLQSQNHGRSPSPAVHFPRLTGPTFIHYHMRVPKNYYHGLGGHGLYFRDSVSRKGKFRGSTVHDPTWLHQAWFNPEWDPFTIPRIRGSGYHRIAMSFEGSEPGLRGEWHSYQFMCIPSDKDPEVGRIKMWVDGKLTSWHKHDTIPGYDTIWLGLYWHSIEYVKKDTVSNTFEAHTAPPHPPFELFFDNFIVSKKFIEFGPNKAQIERIRFAGFEEGAFKVRFDTTAAATTVGVEWGETTRYGKHMTASVDPPRYFHAVEVDSLKPGKIYHLRLVAQDEKGRELESDDMTFVTPAAGVVPDFQMADWKGEVFQNTAMSGPPLFIRNFKSLAFIGWPGHDSDDIVNTSKPMSVRYTKTSTFKGGAYVFRTRAYDGIKVLVDGEVKRDDVRGTSGHNKRKDFEVNLTTGKHTIVVEHTIWRKDDWERKKSKWLCFAIEPKDTTPPELYAHGIYNSQFYKPEKPRYAGRWSESCTVTIDYGETTQYGQQIETSGHMVNKYFPEMEIGKTIHYRVTATDSSGNRTVLPDATFTVGDTIPPEQIFVTAKRVSDNEIELSFKAPGEDGRHGTAAAYDVRYSSKPLTCYNWDHAKKADDIPAPHKGKTKETIKLTGLPKGKTYYMAIQAVDEHGQRGLLSNIASDPPGPEIMDIDGDGYGVGSLKGPDPDDYNAAVPGR